MKGAVEHIPADMTVTVPADFTLPQLQTLVAEGGQWLPLDPPVPDALTVADLISRNLSGPRRFGYGTVRDYVIGLKVRLADGRVIKCGGKVVKNVAGYDLQKLFIGAHGSLGTVVEATFKLRPLPAAAQFMQRPCANLAEADQAIATLLDSPVTPVVLDLHTVNTISPTVVLAFEGSKEEVEWQSRRAEELDFAAIITPAYEKTFWSGPADEIYKGSVLPSKLVETIESLALKTFVARAGNGVFYTRQTLSAPNVPLPDELWRRAKTLFDPKNLLPPLPA